MAKTTSVIIRAFNEEVHIPRPLHGLQQQSIKPNEIILVDSGSTDRTPIIAKSFGVEVIFIAKQNFTFGRALNLGCSRATGEILLFLSAHVYPLNTNWLELMIMPFQDKKVVCTFGKQRGDESTKFSEHQIFAAWFPESTEAIETPYFCNNANCAIRRDTWLKNPYDEQITGLEDLAWAKVQHRKMHEIKYVPEATVVHIHNESWTQIRNRYRREALALKKIEPEMQMSIMQMGRLILWSIALDFVAAIRQKNVLSNTVEIVLFRINQYFGSFQGFNSEDVEIAKLRHTFYYPRRKESISPSKSQWNAKSQPQQNTPSSVNYENF